MIVSLLLAAREAAGQGEAPTLEPDWSRTFKPGIEWCAPVGGESASALLVCTKDTRVELLDVKTGQRRWPEPIAVQPGARFAGESDGVAYCYGPSQVYAVRTTTDESEHAGLLWRSAAAPRAQTEGDPEFMTRLGTANATPDGVLIVRSDGHVAELRRSDGSTRWQHKLPKLANCKSHVGGSEAALLWKDGSAFCVAFFDLRAAKPQPVLTRVAETLPIWTTLADDGLVAVWRKRFAVIPRTGEPQFHGLQQPVGASASTVAVYTPAEETASTQPAQDAVREPLLFLPGADGNICAYDLRTGDLAWPAEDNLPPPVHADGHRALWVSGEYVVQLGASWFAVCRVDGRIAFHSGVCRYEPLSAGVHGRFAYGLLARAARRVEQSGSRAVLLARGVIRDDCRWKAPDWNTLESREFMLDGLGPACTTFWIGGTLAIIEGSRVRAYTLP